MACSGRRLVIWPSQPPSDAISRAAKVCSAAPVPSITSRSAALARSVLSPAAPNLIQRRWSRLPARVSVSTRVTLPVPHSGR